MTKHEMTLLPVQTRDGEGELKYFKTVKEAFQYATENRSVWKISFSTCTGERVRFVREWLDDDGRYTFEYSDLMDEVKEELRKEGLPEV